MKSGEGPIPAKIMLVGECWGDDEERKGEPFQGRGGQELNRILHEVGIMRSECYATNLVNERPPWGDIERWMPKTKKGIQPGMKMLRERMVDPKIVAGFEQLKLEIAGVKPNVIVTAGNASLWALTGAEGALKWRGSQLKTAGLGPGLDGINLIPVIHPNLLLYDTSLRAITVHDFRRVARWQNSKDYDNVPKWNFTVRPSFPTVLEALGKLAYELDTSEQLVWIDFDLETRAGHIACAGLSWSLDSAICIPFMCVEDREGYWSLVEEAEIVFRLYKILTHSNVAVRWQNGLYDAQYTYRHWHFVPRGVQDTMLSHHTCFAGLPKALDFQASMYCDHYVYWKDDGKTWAANMSEEQLWAYNGVDCVRTRECGEAELYNIQSLGLEEQHAFMQKMFWPVLQAMQRGIRVDKKRRDKFAAVVLDEMSKREEYFYKLLGHTLNPRSPTQMQKLFYEDFMQPKIMSKAKKGKMPSPTLNSEALAKIALREPILRGLIRRIEEYRSLGVFLGTFIRAPLDIDDRMRTSYNLAGTETFRLSSSENAFGSGGNLQNIPKGGEDDDSDLELPNIRSMYVPDPGFTIFDTDLSKADLRIVVWESGETEMKAMLREGRDPYVETAREFYKDPALKKTREDGSENPKYRIFKSFSHGTHYLGTPVGLSRRLGLTVHEAERTQRWYLGKYPKIKAWQDDFKQQVAKRRYVENKFGFRRYYFDTITEDIFRQAIAWVPQSTVGLYINKIWLNIYERYPDIWILLQVHDSLVGQFPTVRKDYYLKCLAEASNVVIPYDDPLVIPVGLKTSDVSWGECG